MELKARGNKDIVEVGGNMALFTFILDYSGGTYLSQVDSKNHVKAPGVWSNQLNANHLGKKAELFKNQLISLVDSESPVAVEGLVNTWCLTFTLVNELAIVHYCKTAK